MSSNFYNQFNDESKIRIQSEIKEHWESLDKDFSRIIEHTVKHLTLINAGGAVANLSYIATTKDFLWSSMVCFSLGLVFVGFLVFFLIHRSSNLYFNWIKKTEKFYNSEISYRDLLKSNDDIAFKWSARIGFFIAWASFICFLLGLTSGFYTVYLSV